MSHDLQTIQTHNAMVAAPETSSSVLAAGAKAMIEGRLTVAYRNPRNEENVRQRLLKECKRTSFASVALYAKPIGGSRVTGFSIRFAEGALRMMGNVDIQSPTIFDDATKRIIRVTVTDLEANLAYSQDILIEKTVERKRLKDGQKAISSRLNSYGETVHLIEATEDELLVKQAALISKAIRTQGLRIIPGDLLDEAKYYIGQTMQAQDHQNPDEARRRVFDAFNEHGVTIKHLQEYLGHDGSALNPKELQDLREVYGALREGETTWKDVIEAKTGKQPEAGTGSIKGKPLTDALKQAAGKQEAPQDEPQGDTLQAIHDAMAAATNEDDLVAAWDRTRMLDPQPAKKDLAAINAFYTKRSGELAQ